VKRGLDASLLVLRRHPRAFFIPVYGFVSGGKNVGRQSLADLSARQRILSEGSRLKRPFAIGKGLPTYLSGSLTPNRKML
jgi:hypothetical protein